MSPPSLETFAAEVDLSTERLLVIRLRGGLWTILAVSVAIWIMDRFLASEPFWFEVHQLAHIALLASGLALLRLSGAIRHASAIAFAITAASAIFCAGGGILLHDSVSVAMIFVLMALGTATLLPWGLRPQLGIIAIAATAMTWNVRALHGGLPAELHNPIAALAVSFAVSAYIAYEFARHRGELAETNAENRHLEQARRDVLAMISHDLKTPLSAIAGFADMLMDPDVEERDFIVERIKANAHKAIELAANFVDAARIENGSLRLERERASLNEIVERAVREQEGLAREREIAIDTRLDSGLPALSLDQHQLDRVVANLISNAIKFSPEKSRVSVETGRTGGRVVLSVCDHGPGVRPEDRPKLFERYSRATDGHTEGSGLGLFIVKKIVDAHGGAVRAEFPMEGGSRFEVLFDAPTSPAYGSDAR